MPKGTERLLKSVQRFVDVRRQIFVQRYGQQLIDIFELPIRIVLSPFTLAYDIAGSAPRGFGIPELVSNLSFSAIFVVATLGTYDIALGLGRKVLSQRNCSTCNGWQALRCTMCKGTGKVHYQVKNYTLKSGERATAESVADAIADNRAELVHLPSSIDLPLPLPSKECPSCNGSGVMSCPECKHHQFQIRISADNIIEPPWQAYNILKKMNYPYENIVHSMRDPKVAAFWLLTMPQTLGGFEYDDDIKQKIWWTYQESMRYDQLRDMVARRKPGWEQLQEALISIDPVRAKDDPVIVKNIPYYKAKAALEAEVMKLDAPPRPQNWGQDLELPLNASSWTKEELKDPKKQYEMTILLNAQREIAEKILDEKWESKWRQDKLNELLEEKVRPCMESIDTGVLPRPIIIKSMEQEQKKRPRQRRWWLF